MKVDKEKFEAIVGNLLKTPPASKGDEKTGRSKVEKVMPSQVKPEGSV